MTHQTAKLRSLNLIRPTESPALEHDLYVIGDIHGEYDKLVGHLQTNGLIDSNLRWRGDNTRLWFMGDFVDRGRNGIGVIELVMRLQREARDSGGEIGAILGNHDAIYAAVWRFGKNDLGNPFRGAWLINGGLLSDLERTEDHHVMWLSGLPAMARVGRYLFIHADSLLYTHYGDNLAEVNASIYRILHSDDMALWELLLDQFADRMAFMPRKQNGTDRAMYLLNLFGGDQIIHGHTPIHYAIGSNEAFRTVEPMRYAHHEGRHLCMNIDGGMYSGGPGFIVKLD